jgi:hypothetical protein
MAVKTVGPWARSGKISPASLYQRRIAYPGENHSGATCLEKRHPPLRLSPEWRLSAINPR